MASFREKSSYLRECFMHLRECFMTCAFFILSIFSYSDRPDMTCSSFRACDFMLDCEIPN